MKIEIEVYKAQTIYYDDENDKFVCDISVEDGFKTSKRGSLNDLRKEIDQFYKLNLNFKPFDCFQVDSYDKTFSVQHISGIRTDGKLIIGRKDSNYKSHYDAKDAMKLRKFNADILSEKESLEANKAAYIKEYNNKIAALCENLVPLDLSKYDLK